jgi:hypothetical protein
LEVPTLLEDSERFISLFPPPPWLAVVVVVLPFK